jgi:tyrosyl-tRNA synthetase
MRRTFVKLKLIDFYSMNFVEELKWRGMVYDVMSGTEELLLKEQVTAYVGIDPTADSLHIGHLCGIMMLRHFQRCGHKPVALIGGATGMIGDPSGKSAERNLLDEKTLRHNQTAIKNQLAKFLDFDSNTSNAAILVNNYDWMKEFSFLDFVREIGKHITVNYMMAKDSVKKRLNGETRDGLSFTEFTYQLLQGYDFLHLYQTKGCKLQMGGSDQWGNITTGTELIRRIAGGEAYGLTCPLITKADGSKFGKTESGNIWLDAKYTSPYKFCQFWLNVSDEEAERYIKIFTSLNKEEIDGLIFEHAKAPHLRILQKRLAKEVTVMVHSEEDYNTSVETAEILFSNAASGALKRLDEDTLLAVLEGIPQFEVSGNMLGGDGVKAVDLFVDNVAIFPSKSEMRKLVQGGGVSLNKEKLTAFDQLVTNADLLNGKYLLVQKGKKNHFLIVVK